VSGIFHFALLRAASLLVPGPQRAEWLAEWSAELCYVRQAHRATRATAFCLGAFHDAFWLRRNNPAAPSVRTSRLQSPWLCLSVLAILAAASLLLAFRLPAVREIYFPGAALAGQPRPITTLFCFCLLAVSCVLLPSVTHLSLGEYPPHCPGVSRATRIWRWLFLAAKLALVLPVILIGSLDFFSLISVGLQVHGLIVSGVVGLRWVLMDQRRRCPVCLRALSCPTPIGEASRTFLELYGTEFFCPKGHGLLHVPEIPNSYSTQRWLHLDSSWSSLF
jgi:hypothetical protein